MSLRIQPIKNKNLLISAPKIPKSYITYFGYRCIVLNFDKAIAYHEPPTCPPTKGQLISKCRFGAFNFFQKTNKNKSTWGIIVVKSNLFVRFFGRNVGMKKSFQLGLTFRVFCFLLSLRLLTSYLGFLRYSDRMQYCHSPKICV